MTNFAHYLNRETGKIIEGVFEKSTKNFAAWGYRWQLRERRNNETNETLSHAFTTKKSFKEQYQLIEEKKNDE